MQIIYFLMSMVCVAYGAPAGSYQYVKFVQGSSRSQSGRSVSGLRTSRSFSFDHDLLTASLFDHDLRLDDWTGGEFRNKPKFEINRGHITPDFSNGLEYPDPFLLTGFPAKKAADFLYRKPLFFNEINHIESLRYNQELRRKNGLAGHNLGSLRSHLPWYRFKDKNFNLFN